MSNLAPTTLRRSGADLSVDRLFNSEIEALMTSLEYNAAPKEIQGRQCGRSRCIFESPAVNKPTPVDAKGSG